MNLVPGKHLVTRPSNSSLSSASFLNNGSKKTTYPFNYSRYPRDLSKDFPGILLSQSGVIIAALNLRLAFS